MKRVLRKYGITVHRKVLAFLLSLATVFLYVFYIEPSSFLYISGFIILLSATFFVGVSLILPKTFAILSAFCIFFLSLFKALQILDFMTFGILVAFIIALAFYLKQK